MDRLTSMAVFVRAVDRGSLSAAARDFQLSPAMVGKHLRSLEDRVGTTLLHRTTRRQSLTEVGQLYYERCTRILDEVDEADRCATPFNAEPRGSLRVTAASSFGENLLAPAIATLLARHPRLDLELVLTDRLVDLVAEGFDAAIRIGPLADSQLVTRRLADSQLVMAAAPAYLERCGTPRRPADLARHTCLTNTLGSQSTTWPLVDRAGPRPVRIRRALKANHGRALCAAAVAGAGLVLQPDYVLAPELRTGALVRVLPRCCPPPVAVHVVFSAQRPTPKLRALIDFLVERFGKTLAA